MNSYVVKSGDSLSKIASMNGMSLSQLLSLNPQFASNPNLIKPGQSVSLSAGGPSTQVQNSAPMTQAQLDAQYASAVSSHPVLSGNTPEALSYASSTGDYSGLVNNQGKPFSAADQQTAINQATTDLAPYYQAQQTKDTGDATTQLATTQAGYQKFLGDQAAQFKSDKMQMDQTDANQGVLFSGGRAQRNQNLADSYNRTQDYTRTQYGNNIANTARNFGYNYGDTAANGLSQYYSLGGNTYNASSPTNGVGSSGLSSVYNSNQGFQGTQVNAAKAAAQNRAAGLLYNKGNKLVGSGYSNQF